ncbi:KR domain-containing protein [Actinomadura graeca]|uniref:KR domain-containing protein n=1 Tax=Actinomadura graeca TaxID=2750812 RepID=A0ABX8QX21_9ACTN|nr:KR domain-containing protein [Actinomadura graeca]QXJ23391.1 KR domain-containing protein [Actinomadura graeca]
MTAATRTGIGAAAADPAVPRAAGDTTGGPDSAAGPVSRMIWTLTPAAPRNRHRPADAPRSERTLAGRRIVVVGGTGDAAGHVRAELRERGADVLPAEALPAGGGATLDAVVDLTLAERFAADDPGRWREPFLRTLAVLRGCYDAWSAETTAGRLTYLAVTYLGGGMGYHPDDDIAQPLGGLWAGLAKTLHREFPNCAARVLDIALADAGRLPGLVADELCRTGLTEIGHRDGRRWTLTPEAVPPGPPAVSWGPDDTLLVSGGGRGIGMALARAMAAEFGMRVVVTGRAPLPDERTWPELTPEALRERRAALWAEHAGGRPVAEIRRAIARESATWEVVGNLLSARDAGLRVDYLPCDFTDAGQVRALVARLPGLTAVVHNAGVDHPARLPRKSDDVAVSVVKTKVDSFTHLLDAVRDRRLKVFCTVGSLTGRLGGMVGQFDYAAANECLARLGHWATRQVPFPVMTLAWPTWARLGLIANFEASLRYMTALDVDAGLRHWRAELLAGSRGEVTFVGRLGRALDPEQASSYPMPPCLPGFADTHPKVFHLGEPRLYRAGDRLDSVVGFDAAKTPALGDFTVGGVPALPVGLLLENAVRGAEWVLPEELAEPVPPTVEELSVPWPLLCADEAGRVTLSREMRGEWRDGAWVVSVTFERRTGAPRTARLRLAFGTRPVDGPGGPRLPRAPAPPAQGTAARPAGALLSGAPAPEWRGLAIPLASWRPEGAHRVTAEVDECRPGDLWAVPRPPRCAVPVAAIENLVRAVVSPPPAGLRTVPHPLVISRITMHGARADRVRIAGDPVLGVWHVRDAGTDAPVALIQGLGGHRREPSVP